MPSLSDSMETGTILKWFPASGTAVAAGDELFEVETGKATVVVVAEHDGVLQIVAAEGSDCEVGAVVARLAPASDTTPVVEPPQLPPVPTSLPTQMSAFDVAAAEPIPSAAVGQTQWATPLARRVAKHHGVGLDAVVGTGPGRRVTRNDVLAAVGVEQPVKPLRPQPVVHPKTVTRSANGEVRPLTRLQQVVARRMLEAKTTVPHFQVQIEARTDALRAFRKSLIAADSDAAPSLNDLLIKAAALALVQHPLVNAAYSDDGVVVNHDINVGFAVAADSALAVPTVGAADRLSLGAIARITSRLAERVRDGSIGPDELEGGTFTISNLGMYGASAIFPVINVPQVAIMGVGAARDTLVLEEGVVVSQQVLTLTLSADHRVLYGADAAAFLKTVRELLEEPLRLVL